MKIAGHQVFPLPGDIQPKPLEQLHAGLIPLQGLGL